MAEVRTAPVGQARGLTAFQKNILTVLSEQPRYGLAIKRELEEYYGEEINHGRLYPNLDDLVGMGLVGKSELDKRTNQYTLTDQGVEAVFGDLAWALSKFTSEPKRTDRIRSLIDGT